VARKAQSVYSKSLVLTTTVARTTAVGRVSEKKLQKQSKTLVKGFQPNPLLYYNLAPPEDSNNAFIMRLWDIEVFLLRRETHFFLFSAIQTTTTAPLVTVTM
jgi:hypothetical protein